MVTVKIASYYERRGQGSIPGVLSNSRFNLVKGSLHTL